MIESDSYDSVDRLIEIILADETMRMGEIVRKAHTGVGGHGMRMTISIKIATSEEEGSDYPDLPVPC